ncbi:MAG: hypothetical protein LBP40_02210, partial [Campylobacteraceae bacterium]|nr:hypothetical protein [Campylobacteraceae bacterium]
MKSLCLSLYQILYISNNYMQKRFKIFASVLFAFFISASYANAAPTVDCNSVYAISDNGQSGSVVHKFDDISTRVDFTSTNIAFQNSASNSHDIHSTLAIGYAPDGSGGVTNEIRVYKWRYHEWLITDTASPRRPKYFISGVDENDPNRFVNYNAAGLEGRESAGGEVNQFTGEIYLSSGHYDTIAAGTFTMSVINPLTGAARSVKFTKSDASEPDLGQTVSDMVIDAEGNTFIIARGSDGKNYIVRLDMKTGKYNTVIAITGVFTGETHVQAGGLAILNGFLYAMYQQNIYKINPVNGNSSLIGNTNRDFNDLSSCQLVPLATGNIYNDINGDGVLDDSEKTHGIEGVRVELYDKSHNLLGAQTTRESGAYSFILNSVTNDEYYIRVVNPTIKGKRAFQTWASGGSFRYLSNGENIVRNYCTNFSSDDTAGSSTNRTCYGARADGGDAQAGTLNGANYYSKITMNTDKAVAHVDFAFN